MYKPIIKTKTTDNDCYNDTVIIVPELGNNAVQIDKCTSMLSIVQYACGGCVAILGIAGAYLLFNSIYGDMSVEELNVASMNTMGDIPIDNIFWNGI